MKLPSAPLIAAAMMGQPAHTEQCVHCPSNGLTPGVCVSDGDIAERVGVSRWTVTNQWRKGGGIWPSKAEQYATALGLHPFELWPELADQAVREATKGCLTCGEPFVLRRSDQRFCGRRCREASPEYRARRSAQASAARKARRLSDPEWRRSEAEYSREYKRAAARAMNAYKRRHHAKNSESVNARRRERYAERKREAA